MFTGDGESSPPPPRRCWYPPQPRRCRRLALRGAGKGWGGPGRVLPGWGTPGGQGGGEEGRRVLEQLGADGRGEAPSFLRRPPPLPASTVDGAEGEGRAPTMGWLHFRVLMPILQANSVRLIRVCSRESTLLERAFPCSPGRRKTLIARCLVRKSPPPTPPRPLNRACTSTSTLSGGSQLHGGDHLPCVASTYVWPVQPRSQVFIFLLIDFRVSCHRWLVAPTPPL